MTLKNLVMAVLIVGHSSFAIADTLTVHLDYTTANPLSLVVKDHHWIEDAVGPDIQIGWDWKNSSRESLNSLDARGLDIGSTSAIEAFMARAGGTRVKIFYVTSHSDGFAVLVRPDNPAATLSDLKGMRVAAARGSETHLFLVQALAAQGLSGQDITLVPLHAENGRVSLDRGEVAAWSAQEPDVEVAALEAKDKIVYQNADLTIDGTLAVRESFLAAHPDIVQKVVKSYEQARSWAPLHPAEMTILLATAAKISPTAAERALSHTSFAAPYVDDKLRQAVTATATALISDGILPADTAIPAVEDQLFETSFNPVLP